MIENLSWESLKPEINAANTFGQHPFYKVLDNNI
jgi:hypothetical protein